MLHGLKYTIFNCIFFHNMYQIMSAQTKIYYFIWICNPYISLIVFLDNHGFKKRSDS
ncbi:hypothetical protein KM92DES2_11138 [uncultured Desulfovibrio sp.]|uniref:Uncharacterized protein n=2 Tax=Bacteria TaxID=2 RepID=A0A212JHT8_9BACT|nr:hypothetical protein KM92DES2_11138 [uncultured Desulfovibrio sp.]